MPLTSLDAMLHSKGLVWRCAEYVQLEDSIERGTAPSLTLADEEKEKEGPALAYYVSACCGSKDRALL